MDWMIRIYPSSTKPSTLEIGGISTFRGPYSTTSQGLENIDPACNDAFPIYVERNVGLGLLPVHLPYTLLSVRLRPFHPCA
jgi:hypothetical protein